MAPRGERKKRVVAPSDLDEIAARLRETFADAEHAFESCSALQLSAMAEPVADDLPHIDDGAGGGAAAMTRGANAISAALAAHIGTLARELLPNGHGQGATWRVGGLDREGRRFVGDCVGWEKTRSVDRPRHRRERRRAPSCKGRPQLRHARSDRMVKEMARPRCGDGLAETTPVEIWFEDAPRQARLRARIGHG
jgi:hypothetical protein